MWDVTKQPGSREAAGHEAEITELEGLGFEVLARIQLGLPDVEAAAAGYREPDATWFRENAGRPTTILGSPDRLTLADLSPWFGGEPSVRFRSRLADGSLIETNRPYARAPIRVRPGLPYDGGIGHSPSTGRSIRLVTDGLQAHVAAHAAHVAELSATRGQPPVPLNATSFMDLVDATLVHGQAWHARGDELLQRWRVGLRALALCLAGFSRIAGVPLAGAATIGGVAWLLVPLVSGWLGPLAAARIHADPPPFLGASRPPPTRWAPVFGLGLLSAGVLLGLALVAPLEAAGLALLLGFQNLVFALAHARSDGEPVPAHLPRPELAVLGDDAEDLAAAARAGDVLVVGHPDRIEVLAPLLPEPELQGWAASDDPRGALALGHARLAQAWRARGDGTFDTVDPAAMHAFGRLLREAEGALRRAAALDPVDPRPHAVAVQVAIGQGSQDLDVAFHRATLLDPAHRRAHEAMLQARCAKWYGSHDEALAFARAAPPGLEDLIVQAHAEIAWDQGDHFGIPEVVAEIRAAWQIGRDTQDSNALNRFAYGLWAIGDLEAARDALARVGRRITPYPWASEGDPWAMVLHVREAVGLPPVP